MATRPRDLKYSQTHEWVKVESGEAVIGITDYAVGQLSDLVSLELPAVGDAVDLEDVLGEIESVKTVAELITPVAGKVTAVNKELADNLDTLKENPFEDGWMVRIKMKNAKQLGELMSAAEYDEYLKTLKAEHADEKEEAEEEEEESEDEDEEEDTGDDEE